MFGVNEKELAIFLCGDEVETFDVGRMEILVFKRYDGAAFEVNNTGFAVFAS